MAEKVTMIIGWGLALILVYILVSNYKGTVQIGTLGVKGIPPIIQSLQGVGPGYPAPAR